jgi:hypothetical protein
MWWKLKPDQRERRGYLINGAVIGPAFTAATSSAPVNAIRPALSPALRLPISWQRSSAGLSAAHCGSWSLSLQRGGIVPGPQTLNDLLQEQP